MNKTLLLTVALIATSVAAQTKTEPPPLTYGLVIDCSGSVRQNLKDIRATAAAIIEANADSDETFITRFISQDKIENIQNLTSDKTKLIKSLDELYPQGGETALVDGVYFAVRYLAEHRAEGRRALILMTDGEDRASYYQEGELLKFVKEKQIPVHILSFDHPLRRSLEFINKLAQASGGKVVFAETGKDLPAKAAEVIRLLRQ